MVEQSDEYNSHDVEQRHEQWRERQHKRVRFEMRVKTEKFASSLIFHEEKYLSTLRRHRKSEL